MAVFPKTLYPKYGYRSWQEENKVIPPARSGKGQVKDFWNRTRFMADMDFELRTDDALTVYGFWIKNRSTAFDFFDYDDAIYFRSFSSASLIGVGDGANLTFNVNGQATRLYTVYVNGVAKVAGTHYNLSLGTGPVGQDRIIFTGGNAPPNTQLVEMDFTGKGRFTCRFAQRPDKTTSGRARLALKINLFEDM